MPTIDVKNMNLDSGNVALSELQKRAFEFRETRIKWDLYAKGNLITQEDFAVIARLDPLYAPQSFTLENRAKFFNENSNLCVKVLFNLISQLAKEDLAQHVITLIDDLLQEDQVRVNLFKEGLKHLWKTDNVFTQLIGLLNRPQHYIIHQASRIISKFACWGDEKMDDSSLKQYMHWLFDQLRVPDNLYAVTAARCLQMMLRIDYYRNAFVDIGGVQLVEGVLDMLALDGKNFQLSYQLVFCIWCLSFKPNLAEIISESHIIPSLCKILLNAHKEKVTRIILASLRNLLEKPENQEIIQQNAVTMVHGQIARHLENLAAQEYDDEDIKADIDFLVEALEAAVSELSSFDEYLAELKSTNLSWTPVHKSKKFWVENIGKFNEHNFRVVSMLDHLLMTSKDPLVLSVAAHDIGMYVGHYPYGKKVVDSMPCKIKIMSLLEHENPGVRYNALLSLQKIMVSNWEYLGKKVEATPSLIPAAAR